MKFDSLAVRIQSRLSSGAVDVHAVRLGIHTVGQNLHTAHTKQKLPCYEAGEYFPSYFQTGSLVSPRMDSQTISKGLRSVIFKVTAAPCGDSWN